MISVCTKNLISAIKETDAYKLPHMNEGTGYLYKNLYSRLFKGEDVKLSSLDFGAFESEDIESLNNLHSDVFEHNACAADGIVFALQQIVPACKAMGYV